MTSTTPKPSWNPYVAGAVLGLVLFGSYALTGHGLGASGALSRVVFAGEKHVAPEHVDQHRYLVRMAGGHVNALDNWLVWVVLGVMLGGLVSGLMGRRVFVAIQRGPSLSATARLVFALLGGVLVGYAAQLARGCTSGQALSGGAVLAAGSWVFMFAVFGGGYAIAYFVRRLWN